MGAATGPMMTTGVASLSSVYAMVVASFTPSPLGENHAGLTDTPLTVTLTTTLVPAVAVCP